MRQAAAGQSVTFGGGSGQQQQAGVRLGSAALNRPASLKLSGAWAFYESRHEEDSLRIRAMEKQVAPRSIAQSLHGYLHRACMDDGGIH